MGGGLALLNTKVLHPSTKNYGSIVSRFSWVAFTIWMVLSISIYHYLNKNKQLGLSLSLSLYAVHFVYDHEMVFTKGNKVMPLPISSIISKQNLTSTWIELSNFSTKR